MSAAFIAARPAFVRTLLALALAVLILAPLAVALPVTAQGTNSATNGPAAPPPRTSLVNPLGRGVTFQTLLGRVTRMIMGVSGSFALLMFVWGGFTWVTSGGNMEKVVKGKKIFTWSVIGLVVIYGSYVLLSIVFKALEGA